MENDRDSPSKGKNFDLMYDRGTIKVIICACCIIILAVVFTGGISYVITHNAMVDKLKNRDMLYIVQSMSEKIDGRIERAQETSLLLADDPTVLAWVESGGRDEAAGEIVKTKITDIGKNYDYVKAFVASTVTNQYWEDNKVVKPLSKTSYTDKWFYKALKSGKKIELNIDYDSIHNETFIFFNTLVGDVRQPVAVAGVALSLGDIAKEFGSYKFGEHSNLWLVDKQGKIHLADDLEYNGRLAGDFLPAEVMQQILGDMDNATARPKVLEYQDSQGRIMDLAYQSTATTDWKLVFQIPRSESIAILSSVKINAIIASVITLLLMVVIFYFISYKIANPFKRALRLAEQMEKQVKLRTHELAEKNQSIMDSIDYAKRLQEAILPTETEWAALCHEYFVLWRPRDVVGGDFYWIRKLDAGGCLIVVGDCTGHGVPGALMTMTVNSILNHIIDNCFESAGQMLAELNCRVKKTLHREDENQVSDDGLDIAICYIEGTRLEFAGARIPLYIKRGGQVHVLKGDNRSIGYRRSKTDREVCCHFWNLEAGDCLYLTTDGYIDQNGGNRDFPMGRKAFMECIAGQIQGAPFIKQRESLEGMLDDYKGSQPQRDDITVIGITF
ncbi:Stage II sporulation protein E (SpoIIE) [Sporomusa ovata DSM 2662]|uniref:SpoIIE family protein phosphatase n=1 Tax=Sporomusa ovata TaxID=2378 RepID=UPI0003884B15|nr:SpoIIE family protein phosphatase [Sporomusa ovata]EQB25083.1 protein serine/threonine phosphatase [Sporomusa ovata DSM 2662]